MLYLNENKHHVISISFYLYIKHYCYAILYIYLFLKNTVKALIIILSFFIVINLSLNPSKIPHTKLDLMNICEWRSKFNIFANFRKYFNSFPMWTDREKGKRESLYNVFSRGGGLIKLSFYIK